MNTSLSRAATFLSIMASLILAILITGCSPSGSAGSSGSVTVSGQIASGSAATANMAKSARSVLSGYEIRVYYFGSGGLSPNDYTTVSIGSDGSFSFPVVSGQAFVAILVDPSATFQKAVGVIGIGTGSDQYWEQVETSETSGNIEMGTIPDVPVDGILITQHDIEQIGATVEDVSTVKLLARIDTSVGFLLNSINGAPDISTQISYVFGRTDDGLAGITGAQPPVAPYYQFAGYQIIVYANGTTSADQLEFVPPAPVEYGNAPSVQESSILGSFFTDHFEFGQGDKPGDALIVNDPSGLWKLLVNGTERADFEYDVAPPTLNGSIALPVPLFHATLRNGTDIIDTISLSWVIADGNGGYTPISPQQLLQIFDPNSFYFEIADFRNSSSGQREGFQFDPTSGPIHPSEEWHTTSSTTGLWAQLINVGYGASGVGVRFGDRQTAP